MKNNNTIEIILSPKHFLRGLTRREFADWVATKVQVKIEKQQLAAKKIFVRSLKSSPAIYMS